MNGELLAILEQIERDKGIDKEKLIEAIEQALIIAAKKIAKITNPDAEISVKIDRTNGKIRAFVGEEEILSESLARIAAQTAKQVIIQKIREAEKEVIFTEFKEKIGTLVSGCDGSRETYSDDLGNLFKLSAKDFCQFLVVVGYGHQLISPAHKRFISLLVLSSSSSFPSASMRPSLITMIWSACRRAARR